MGTGKKEDEDGHKWRITIYYTNMSISSKRSKSIIRKRHYLIPLDPENMERVCACVEEGSKGLFFQYSVIK